MKAALYYREPIDDLNTSYRLIEKALKMEWEYQLFYDVVNKRRTRPEKLKLILKLRKNEFDVLIINSLNSWAKNPTELIREIDELTNKGVIFISLFDRIQLSSSYSDPQYIMFRSFARFEQSILNQKASLAIQRTKHKGKFPGRPIGSKDSKKRKNEGYYRREATKRELKLKLKDIRK